MNHKGSYKEYVNLPAELRNKLPTSFDVVGDVAILKVKDELMAYLSEIRKGLMKKMPYIHHVAIDEGVYGNLRKRKLTFIYEVFDGITVHRENGIQMKVDLNRVYFSPRLAYERLLVLERVKDDEVIIDMFAGVGPFTLLIAKKRKIKRIYAIDLNDTSINLLIENLQINKIKCPIYPIYMDAREALTILEPADRYIMNLPWQSMLFLPMVEAHSKKGSEINFYIMSTEQELKDHIEPFICEHHFQILNTRIVHPYSVTQNLYSIILSRL